MGFIVSFALRIWIVKRITWSGRKGTLPISVCGDGSTAGIYNFIYSACRPAMSLCRTVNQVGRSSSVLYLFVCLFFFVAPITYKMDNGTSQPLDYTVFIYHWCICAIFVWNKSNSKQREERKKEWLWVNAVPGNKQNLRRWNYRTIYTARFEWCMYVLGAILLLSQTALCIIYIYTAPPPYFCFVVEQNLCAHIDDGSGTKRIWLLRFEVEYTKSVHHRIRIRFMFLYMFFFLCGEVVCYRALN